jgi:hypothetical protein
LEVRNHLLLRRDFRQHQWRLFKPPIQMPDQPDAHQL